MDTIVDELLVEFGDVILDKLEPLDKTELIKQGSEIFTQMESENLPDHMKVLCSYILTVLEAVYANNHEPNKLN